MYACGGGECGGRMWAWRESQLQTHIMETNNSAKNTKRIIEGELRYIICYYFAILAFGFYFPPVGEGRVSAIRFPQTLKVIVTNILACRSQSY